MDREELLRSARNLYENPGTNEALKVVLEDTYPELKESEDERIRKMLIDVYKTADMGGEIFGKGITYKQVIAWLEKQKEQKPAEKISVSEELYEHIRNACACIEDAMSSDTLCDMTDYLTMADSSAQKAFDMVEKSVIKQPAEWIEEDKIIEKAICVLEANFEPYEEFSGLDITRCQLVEMLKSLRLHPHWKPSEEQILALKYALGNGGKYDKEALESLYNDLQKL